MQSLKDKKVTVFGAGKSGIASAKKLASLGAKVKITEEKPEAQLDSNLLRDLRQKEILIETGGHTFSFVKDSDFVVVSPGVHLDLPIIIEIKRRGIPIISEIELAYRFLSKPIIAVTGTNGKTTTVTLIGEMLKAGGKSVVMAGNIGNPLVEVDDSNLDFVVAEISSYQLEAIVNFHPWISVILNIQPDHLERHHTLEEYINQKARIFLNQDEHDFLVYNQDDLLVREMVKKAKAKLVPYSKENCEVLPISPEEIKIPGRHNLENSLAATSVAYLCGVSKKDVAGVLHTFPGVEHRIEFVTAIDGVEFYNDSKATNPDSTLVALETFKGRGIILILGGREKGVDLLPLARKIKENVKSVVLIGEAAPVFENVLKTVGYLKFHHVGFSMEQAVKRSLSLASTGDIVLLSPACASFDMFSNFEERGKIFKKICQELKK